MAKKINHQQSQWISILLGLSFLMTVFFRPEEKSDFLQENPNAVVPETMKEVQETFTRYVAVNGNNTGPNDCLDADNPCATIQHAIDLADRGNVIEISAGAFSESLMIRKNIKLNGQGMESTVIQANWRQELSDSRVITISGAPGITEVEIAGITIRHGRATGDIETLNNIGGGILNTYGHLILSNVLITNNSAHKGGGIYNLSGSGTYENVTFENNSAQEGGGLYNSNDNQRDPISLVNVVFRYNTAVERNGRGGGMYNENSSPELTNVSFLSNSADYGGGGMFNIMQSSPILNDVSFIDNTVRGNGGGMYNGNGGGMYNTNSSFPILSNVQFYRNQANFNGGGISNSKNSSPKLFNVSLKENKARHGGGIHNLESNPVLEQVTFNDNEAERDGGGMYNIYSAPTLNHVIFTDNKSISGVGGGMYNYRDSNSLLNHVTFENNSANSNGGGMHNVGSSPMLLHVYFIGNSAGHNGGGMAHNTKNLPQLTNVVFLGNSANWNGGGMAFLDSPGGRPVNISLKFINVSLNGNVAGRSGGGISFQSNPRNIISPMFINVTISNNTANSYANYGGGGIHFDVENSILVLINTILWGNSGDQIIGSSPDISYSLIQNGCPDGANCNNIINQNPLFVDMDTGNFHLSHGSPAINAGDPFTDLSIFPLDENGERIDLDGNPRLQGDRVDLGAYEFQD